jgi:hypothetical protein
VQTRQREVGLGRVGLGAHGALELGFGARHVLVARVERAQRAGHPVGIAQRGAVLLQPPDRVLDLLRRVGGLGDQQQRVEALRLLRQDRLGLLARLVARAPHQVDHPELLAHLEVVRVLAVVAVERPVRLAELPVLVVREPELLDGLEVLRIEAQRVPVLDRGFLPLLLRHVTLGGLQVPALAEVLHHPAARSEKDRREHDQPGRLPLHGAFSFAAPGRSPAVCTKAASPATALRRVTETRPRSGPISARRSARIAERGEARGACSISRRRAA